MRRLVIDTALDACTVGLFGDGAEPFILSEVMARGHQERLGPMAEAVAARAGSLSGVQRIGVTVGPGSFTGLRVGLAFALGVGSALKVPVVGISTLDALAASVAAPGLVASAIDARRGQVYLRLYRDGEPQAAPEAVALDEAVARLRDAGPVRLVGSGAPLLAERAAGIDVHPLVAPTPEALARLTLDLDPERHPARPLYLRAPDATPPTRLPGQPRA